MTEEKPENKNRARGLGLAILYSINLAFAIGGCIYGRTTCLKEPDLDPVAKTAMIRDINNDGLVDICLKGKWYLSTPNGYEPNCK